MTDSEVLDESEKRWPDFAITRVWVNREPCLAATMTHDHRVYEFTVALEYGPVSDERARELIATVMRDVLRRGAP